MIKDDFLTLTAQKFINTYFTSRNFDQVKNMFAPEGSWLGASNNTMANNLKQFDQYFKEGCNEGYVPEITFQDCSTTTIILESFIVIIIYISKAKEPFLIWING